MSKRKNIGNMHRGLSGRRPAAAAGEQGFTMIEMLVSIVVLTVIMAGMFAFLWGASRHWQTAQGAADVNENARLGLNRMTRELRQGSVITDAATDEVSFEVNFGTADETITYGFRLGEDGEAGSVWRETSLDPGQQLTLMDNVESIEFTYYGNDYRCDANGDGRVTYEEIQGCDIGSLASIARVDITLTMRAGTDPERVFLGQAWLRNRIVQ